MSLEDLNLEFEDDEDKKSDAISVDIDLEFGSSSAVAAAKKPPTPGGSPRPVPTPKPTITPKRPATAATNPTMARPESNVRPITPKVVQQEAPSPAATPTPTTTAGSSALKMEEAVTALPEQNDLIARLQEKIEQVEAEAQIKIAVAEFKTDILSDLLSDIKLLEHQVGGLLNRIHTKHPDLKQEVLMLKKLLSDFANKKRK